MDARQGIVHVVGPEQGFTLPGTTCVCGDSHTATHGAFGQSGTDSDDAHRTLPTPPTAPTPPTPPTPPKPPKPRQPLRPLRPLRPHPPPPPLPPGALAFGIGTSEVEHVLATQTLPQAKAKVSGWGVYCQASVGFRRLPSASCCFLLLPVAPSVSCSSVDALQTRSSKLPPSSTVSYCLLLSPNAYNPSKFTPQPPS